MDFYFLDSEIHPVKGAKPCPICGGTDAMYISSAKFYNALFKENGSAILNICCKRCNLRMSVHNHEENVTSYKGMKAALIKKWNTRKEINNESEKN